MNTSQNGDKNAGTNTNNGGQHTDAAERHSGDAFRTTDPEQLIWLAEEILNNPTLRAVIERVGIHGDLTEEDDTALDTFIENLVEKRSWGKHHPYNLLLAVVLARRLTSGVFKDAHSEEVIAFLKYNTMKQASNYIPTPLPHFNEVIFFAEALKNNIEMSTVFSNSKNRPGFNDAEDKKYLMFRYQFEKKYGFFNRITPALNSAIMLNRMLARGEIDNFTDKKALEFLSQHKGTIVAACVFEGMSNV